ncbi:MAG: hypothetical protein C0410_08755 [Anaerolinea sp.]|nr:hypothetical protein [Anaerolinea sp.]
MPKYDIFSKLRTQEKKQQTVTLTLTEDCNLRCRYCYEPNKSRDRYMSLATAQKVVIEYMEKENEFDGVQFDFFGGEPMLAFDLIRELVDWFHTRSWRKEHLFFIGTNGTILTEKMKSWLVQNKDCVWLGISLDGNKIAHDLNRSNSYDLLMRNLPFFRENWPTQPAKMTISAETIPYVAESIIELEEMEIPFSANIVFEDIWGTPEQKVALLDIYAQQLDRLVEYYVVHSDLVPARIVDLRPEFATNERKGDDDIGEDCVRYCGAGHEMVVIEVDGTKSPCHRFSSWVTGKPVPNNLVNHQKSWGPKKCAACRWNKICATCAGFNWQINGDSGVRTVYHCEAFKLELQASAKLHVLRLLQQKPEDIANLTPEEALLTKRRIDELLAIAENGV